MAQLISTKDYAALRGYSYHTVRNWPVNYDIKPVCIKQSDGRLGGHPKYLYEIEEFDAIARRNFRIDAEMREKPFRIRVEVSPKFYADLRRLAKKRGVRLATYCRQVLAANLLRETTHAGK